MMTFGEKVIAFHERLQYTGDPLPKGIRIMNPFAGSAAAMNNIKLFAKKYLDDNNPRHIILGINPGRYGGGEDLQYFQYMHIRFGCYETVTICIRSEQLYSALNDIKYYQSAIKRTGIILVDFILC